VPVKYLDVEEADDEAVPPVVRCLRVCLLKSSIFDIALELVWWLLLFERVVRR
jgi:hypothetical protein